MRNNHYNTNIVKLYSEIYTMKENNEYFLINQIISKGKDFNQLSLWYLFVLKNNSNIEKYNIKQYINFT